VLCDRFTDSTVAYQGYGRGIELRLLRQLNEVADHGLRPDLTFLLDCPVLVGLARASRRRSDAQGRPTDRFEREDAAFHERVRAGFLEMARMEPERFRVVDASRTAEEVRVRIQEIADREIF